MTDTFDAVEREQSRLWDMLRGLDRLRRAGGLDTIGVRWDQMPDTTRALRECQLLVADLIADCTPALRVAHA